MATHGRVPARQLQSRCSSRRCVAVVALQGGGPTGLNVKGFRPTSQQGWAEMAQALKAANVKILPAQEVIFAAERGVPVVDVRPEENYIKGHIPGAVSVQFYQPIQGWTPWQIARRVGYAAFGVFNGTEVNPNFLQEVASVASDKESGVILYCSLGGQFEATEENKKGMQTRSLVAAYALIMQGYKNVSILKGGYAEWVNSGRDVEIIEVEEGSSSSSSAA